MKNMILLLFVSACLFSCQPNEKKTSLIDNNLTASEKNSYNSASKSVEDNVICQINGKDWSYTKASGIVSLERNGILTAIMTFKKKLEKGSEHIQLYYNADTKSLMGAKIILKFPKKGGGLLSCHYNINEGNKVRKPQCQISGTIDLSQPSLASGVADINNVTIDYKPKIFNRTIF